MRYQKDAIYNLFYRPGAETIGYSEGEAVERRLLEIIELAQDRSVCSTELLEQIDDWSTRYHFSRARHCLLRPLDIKAGARVLELGCGTGAITRYLGEIGAEVTAVEGSLARARVAAARCHNLSNVTVIADDLQAVDIEGQYDWVTLIGVLEYAGAYSEANDPYQAYLASAMRHLKPDGKVVIAIENQLGLKYFNGCAEDHLGKPFVGIQDLYAPKRGVRTFGRRVLSKVLSRAGLSDQQWMYPYPDYKLPNVVLTDEALQTPVFEAIDLLVRSYSEDYTGNTLRLFDEGLVNRVLADNGLLADFSNSFLIVASKQQENDKKKNWQPAALAWTFSVVSRQPGHWTETVFKAETKDYLRVYKRRLNPGAPQCVRLFNNETICLEPVSSDYAQARQLTWNVLDAHVRSESLEAIVAVLVPWCKELLIGATTEVSPLAHVAGASQKDQTEQLTESSDGGEHIDVSKLSLPGNAIDHMPFNILIDKQGGQHLIDQEWVASCRVPAGWVVTRGVFHVLHVGITPKGSLDSIVQIVISLLEACGYYSTQEDIERWIDMENRFQETLAGQSRSLTLPARLMTETIASLKVEVHSLQEALTYEQRERAEEVRSLQEALTRERRERAEEVRSLQEALTHERLERAEEQQHSVAEITRLTALVQEIYQSSSWRITSPIRWVGTLVKQIRRNLCI